MEDGLLANGKKAPSIMEEWSEGLLCREAAVGRACFETPLQLSSVTEAISKKIKNLKDVSFVLFSF